MAFGASRLTGRMIVIHRFVSWVRWDADQYDLFLVFVAVPVAVLFVILGRII